jgi:hypothetical protein
MLCGSVTSVGPRPYSNWRPRRPEPHRLSHHQHLMKSVRISRTKAQKLAVAYRHSIRRADISPDFTGIRNRVRMLSFGIWHRIDWKMAEQSLSSLLQGHPFTLDSSLFTPPESCYIPQDSSQPPSQPYLPDVTSEVSHSHRQLILSSEQRQPVPPKRW